MNINNLTEEQLRHVIKYMLLKEAYPNPNNPKTGAQNTDSPFANEGWFNDPTLRNAYEIYQLMQNPDVLSQAGEFQAAMGLQQAPVNRKRGRGSRAVNVPVVKDVPGIGQNIPVMRPQYDPGTSPRTAKTRGNIADNIFNKIKFLHEKSKELYANEKMKLIYDATSSGFIAPMDSSIQRQIEAEVRSLLNRPKISPLQTDFDSINPTTLAQGSTSISENIPESLHPYVDDNKGIIDTKKLQKDISKWPFSSNPFGKTKANQSKYSHQNYAYNADKTAGTKKINESVVVQAYNNLSLNDPAQAYHFIMDNCQLPTGDDVEIAIAHYAHLITGEDVEHIDSTGTDILMSGTGGTKIECKSSKKPNTIEKGLSASFPEDNINKYYFFISNRGNDQQTQLSIVNSMLLRFVLLISDITADATLSSGDPDVQQDYENNVLQRYVTKFGNKNSQSTSDFSWIRDTILTNSEEVIQGFIRKTTLQFQKGNAEDFDDTVTFRVGNAKVMVRTQVNWGLSEEDLSAIDEEESDDINESRIYKDVLKSIIRHVKKEKAQKDNLKINLSESHMLRLARQLKKKD